MRHCQNFYYLNTSKPYFHVQKHFQNYVTTRLSYHHLRNTFSIRTRQRMGRSENQGHEPVKSSAADISVIPSLSTCILEIFEIFENVIDTRFRVRDFQPLAILSQTDIEPPEPWTIALESSRLDPEQLTRICPDSQYSRISRPKRPLMSRIISGP